MANWVNVSKYVPHEIVTIDGRTVLSDSEGWRLCCEAVWCLAKSHSERESYIGMVGHRRGEDGRKYLEQEIARIEPAYLLAFPSKEARVEYLEQVQRHRGPNARKGLEERIVALWEKRKGSV